MLRKFLFNLYPCSTYDHVWNLLLPATVQVVQPIFALLVFSTQSSHLLISKSLRTRTMNTIIQIQTHMLADGLLNCKVTTCEAKDLMLSSTAVCHQSRSGPDFNNNIHLLHICLLIYQFDIKCLEEVNEEHSGFESFLTTF